MPHGYLLDIATSFMLKNQLHASATQVSTFRLMTALPVNFSIDFGLTRDLWNPLGLRDRCFFLIFASLTAAVFMWMALSTLTYSGLFVGMLLTMLSFRFVAAAYQGLIALVGQEATDVGAFERATRNTFMMVPYLLGAFASGYIADPYPRARHLSCDGCPVRCSSLCSHSGSRAPFSAMPMTGPRPKAPISSVMSGAS